MRHATPATRLCHLTPVRYFLRHQSLELAPRTADKSYLELPYRLRVVFNHCAGHKCPKPDTATNTHTEDHCRHQEQKSFGAPRRERKHRNQD